MKSVVAAVLVSALLVCVAGAADAQTDRWRGGAHHASGAPGSNSTKPGGVIMKCKTRACFIIHPSGVYTAKPKPKN